MLTPLKMQRQREAIVCFHHELELHHFLFAAVVYDIKIAIEKRLISSLLVGNICFGSFIRTIHTIASSFECISSKHHTRTRTHTYPNQDMVVIIQRATNSIKKVVENCNRIRFYKTRLACVTLFFSLLVSFNGKMHFSLNI